MPLVLDPEPLSWAGLLEGEVCPEGKRRSGYGVRGMEDHAMLPEHLQESVRRTVDWFEVRPGS